MPLDIDKIRTLMGDRTQSEIAAAMGIARPNLTRLLSDPRANITLPTIEKLAAALGCKTRAIIAD